MHPERYYIKTPVFDSASQTHAIGKSVHFKMDCFQPSGSFKIRGIDLLCRTYFQKGYTHFISSSGGTAGYSVAFVSRQLGTKATVVVPSTTNEAVMEKIRSLGAVVEVIGDVWDEAHAYALEQAKEAGAAYIHPFDDPGLWKGHSTIIDECSLQVEKPDTIVVAVGGGGLLSGVFHGIDNNGWGDCKVVAVETKGAASYSAALDAGKLVDLPKIDSIATSLGAKRVAQEALDLGKKHKVTSVVVSDQQALEACRQFLDEFRVVVEPACGAALSIVYQDHDIIAHDKSVLVLVCGGIGFTAEKLHALTLNSVS